jgi:hypothetical protein
VSHHYTSVNEGDGDLALRRVGGSLWGMCALIAGIAVLMEVNQF